ncbi:MAG: M28 family peptidase [Flavobacteriales bacterium]
MKKIFMFSVALIGSALLVNGQSQADEVKRMSTHVQQLSSDLMEGRGTGTAGEAMAAKYIADTWSAYGLAPKGTDGWLQKFSFIPKSSMQIHHGDTTTLGMSMVKESYGTNVIAFLDNQAQTTIIIGAHFDHLGWGDENSLWTGTRAIHNGADDNASGVSMLLELSKWLSQHPEGTTQNNYLFIAFSGEEKGLYGSNYFAKNPTMPLTRVSCMLNMDMVGRLNNEGALAVNGTGTCKEWKKILKKAKVEGIQSVFSESGMGASDHTSFYLMNLPVLHFFTGQHEDYHKPSDDFEKINVAGMERVFHYIQGVVLGVNKHNTLHFKKTVDATPSASDFKVTLGVMPDYLYSGKGLKIDGCKEDRPGIKAGLQQGDIILKLGDYAIEDIYGYMEALGKFEQGQSTTMEVDRAGKIIKMKVKWE